MPRRYYSSRRRRFTVTLAGGKREVVLAYTPANAADYFARRGAAVEAVAEGDYRCDPVERGGGWSIDLEAYADAREFLGLKWPVKIVPTSRQGGQWGAHRLDSDTGQIRHKITVKSWLTPEEAGRTLWHELCHAMQSERVAASVGAASAWECRRAWYQTPERTGSYRNQPIEVEARSYEAFNEERPLALPATTLGPEAARR